MAVVELSDVSIVRSGATLLDGINWTVEEDERWVVIGPNGAGKTTLLQVVGAQWHPTRGTASILDETLGAVDVFELRPRIGVASAALADRIPKSERVSDVVMSAAYAVMGRWRENYDETDLARAAVLMRQLQVDHLSDRTFGTLSEGERKRVQIARALMTDPELLLLDEPAAGLDENESAELARLIRRLADERNMGVLLVEHDVGMVMSTCDRIVVIDYGSVIASGTPEEIRRNPAVRDAYLGHADGTEGHEVDLDEVSGDADTTGVGSDDTARTVTT